MQVVPSKPLITQGLPLVPGLVPRSAVAPCEGSTAYSWANPAGCLRWKPGPAVPRASQKIPFLAPSVTASGGCAWVRANTRSYRRGCRAAHRLVREHGVLLALEGGPEAQFLFV